MNEQKIDWSQVTYPLAQTATLSIRNIKPNYNMVFHKDGKQIVVLDWNGPQMTFTGEMEEGAKMFFDWVAKSFAGRLEQERKAAREWVGLTDEERAEIRREHYARTLPLMDAVEAKLKEKNT